MHLTAEARTDEDLALCSFFWKYLNSTDEADLPRLPDGSEFPKRQWQLMKEMLEKRGVDVTDEDEDVMMLRTEEEDHPAIKELAGRKPNWWEENFFGEREAEKLRRYSPW